MLHHFHHQSLLPFNLRLLQHLWLSFDENFYSFCFLILFQELLHFSCPLQAKNSRFEFFVYELTVGDRFGSSRAYEPSSFLRIRYTMNMTTKMAHSRPTTAPPITAATTIHVNMSNSSGSHTNNKYYTRTHARTTAHTHQTSKITIFLVCHVFKKYHVALKLHKKAGCHLLHACSIILVGGNTCAVAPNIDFKFLLNSCSSKLKKGCLGKLLNRNQSECTVFKGPERLNINLNNNMTLNKYSRF